jgi:arylsulfatase A-like enzyme
VNVVHIVADTLRRDHCGPWHQGRPVRALGDPRQPDWVVPTPNMDRLAARGTVFDQAWCGSHPCMPARRDLYTGRLEFPWRGWGPLEDDDDDLPRRISGPPNHSLDGFGRRISQLVTDHFHLWEQGAGNYHMGFSGFEFIRGMEADAWHTDPVEVPLPSEAARGSKIERHFRNLAVIRERQDQPAEATYFPPRTFGTAARWLERNHTWPDFYLHIDSFPPHEPWDPPERLLTLFDDRGYDVPAWDASPRYALVGDTGLTKDDERHIQARYAASVVHVDESLGMLLDVMDRHDLWETTMVIFTTDHGTYNGSRQRIGKLQTHLHTPISQIPLIVAHPTLAHGERRNQLVQLVDCYPTVLEALGEPVPEDLHGRSMLSLLEDASAPGHDVAVCGIFGEGITVSDGDWALHIAPAPHNQPLYWYSHHQSRFFGHDLGPYECLEDGSGRRSATLTPMEQGIWLSDLDADPYECENVAGGQPGHVRRLARMLRARLEAIDSPPEQLERLCIDELGGDPLRPAQAGNRQGG